MSLRESLPVVSLLTATAPAKHGQETLPGCLLSTRVEVYEPFHFHR